MRRKTTMTAIVGLVHGKDVWIGGDSAVTDDSFFQDLISNAKVFQNGPMLFGICGSGRLGDLLEHALRVPKRKSTVSVSKYIRTAFITSVRACFTENGFQSKASGVWNPIGDEDAMNGAFLVGYERQLFIVYSDYSVDAPKFPFAAVGCGDAIALGAMYAMHDGKEVIKPEEQIRRALAASARFSAGVRPPFVIRKLVWPKPKKK